MVSLSHNTYHDCDPVSNDYIVLAALATVVLTVLVFPKRRHSHPGPPGWPIIGNIFELPTKESWKAYLNWSKQYDSDVLSMRVPGARLFVLNSAEAIQGLLIKRSSIYSDRPRSTMLNELIRTTWMMRLLLFFPTSCWLWRVTRRSKRKPTAPWTRTCEVKDSRISATSVAAFPTSTRLLAKFCGGILRRRSLSIMSRATQTFTRATRFPIPNIWALLRQESGFGPNTDKFTGLPDRFLKADGDLNPDILNLDIAFGFGRRSCPGRVMGRDTVWIMVASMLAAYEICDPVDLSGKGITPQTELEFTNAMVSFAPPFKVSFKPRISESMITDNLTDVHA
ncbi:hypothetical protein BDZ89DRAFT_1163664, partial [Hymenopellis radicata]